MTDRQCLTCPELVCLRGAHPDSQVSVGPLADVLKRASFAATYGFSAINGLNITATGDEVRDFVVGLYDAVDNLHAWLAENIKAR